MSTKKENSTNEPVAEQLPTISPDAQAIVAELQCICQKLIQIYQGQQALFNMPDGTPALPALVDALTACCQSSGVHQADHLKILMEQTGISRQFLTVQQELTEILVGGFDPVLEDDQENQGTQENANAYSGPGDDEAAATLYHAYCESVGGVAMNGDPLPSWADFAADPDKAKQVKAWRDLVTVAYKISPGGKKGTSTFL